MLQRQRSESRRRRIRIPAVCHVNSGGCRKPAELLAGPKHMDKTPTLLHQPTVRLIQGVRTGTMESPALRKMRSREVVGEVRP